MKGWVGEKGRGVWGVWGGCKEEKEGAAIFDIPVNR